MGTMIRKLMLRAARMLAFAGLALGLTSVAIAQPKNYLNRMPSIADVKAAIQGSDEFDREARRAMVFDKLMGMVYALQELSGRERWETTPEESALLKSYRPGRFDYEQSDRWDETRRREFYGLFVKYGRDQQLNNDWMSKLLPDDIRAAVQPWHQEKYGPGQARDPVTLGNSPEQSPRMYAPVEESVAPWAMFGPFTLLMGGFVLLGLSVFFALPMLVSPVSLRQDGDRSFVSLGGKTFALVATSGLVTSWNEWRERTVDTQSGQTLSSSKTQEFTVADSTGKKHPFTAVNRGLRMDVDDALTVFQLHRSRWLHFLGIYNHSSERFFGTKGGVEAHIKLGFLSCLFLTLGVIVWCAGAVVAHRPEVFGYDYDNSLPLAMTWVVALSGLALIPIMFFLKRWKASSAAEAVREKCLRPYMQETGAVIGASGARIAADGSITLPDGTVIRGS